MMFKMLAVLVFGLIVGFIWGFGSRDMINRRQPSLKKEVNYGNKTTVYRPFYYQ